jgi:hypothetical protein
MKVRPQQIIHKLLPLPFIIRPARLVPEDDVVVPPPLDAEVGLVEQRVAERDIALLRLLLRGEPLALFPLAALGALATDAL